MKSKYFICLYVCIMLYACKQNAPLKEYRLNGAVFGTDYNIVFFDNKDRSGLIQVHLDSLFDQLNESVSTYIPTSAISKINQGDLKVEVDDYFIEVFNKSKRIYKETGGVFDPTVGNLVNAWGFGPDKPTKGLNKLTIDSLLKQTGFDKIKLKNRKIIRTNQVTFDFNAIAKGYGLDLVGRYFEKAGIVNYLIEIGGEIRASGINLTKDNKWKVAIEAPNFDGRRSVQQVILLSNQVMATSGSYRKFKIDSVSGARYHHIINPKTGYPSKSNLLSVSVISKGDCADVDAYATALMAMTLDQAKLFLQKNPDLMAYLIFSDDNREIDVFSTSNFKGLHDGL